MWLVGRNLLYIYKDALCPLQYPQSYIIFPYANFTGSFSLYCFHVLLNIIRCMPNESQLLFLSEQHPATGISIGIPNNEISIPSDHCAGTVDCIRDMEILTNEIN